VLGWEMSFGDFFYMSFYCLNFFTKSKLLTIKKENKKESTIPPTSPLLYTQLPFSMTLVDLLFSSNATFC